MSDAIELDEDQARAVAMIADPATRVGVLTGGPGRGKTTCLRSAISLLRRAGKTVALAAPTGKAARRMSAACEYPAQTLHRLLGIGPGGMGGEEPLGYDVVIVDEASMLDVYLGAALMRSIDPRFTRLFFVGDKDQLPSVGPGYVLGDLIASGRVPVVELKKLHRAAAHSWVARNAPRFLTGEEPDLAASPDFRWIPVERGGAEACAHALLKNLEEELSRAAELTGAADINGALEASQILIPMKKGPVGVETINTSVQAAVQGDYLGAGGFHRDAEVVFYTGDKVLQTKNDYLTQVMNGETGIVQGVTSEKKLLVRFDDREVEFSKGQAFTLELGYATTIHKGQGSEWPLCIVVCHSSHGRMLSRQLIYTAITRAKQRLVLIGDRAGLDATLRNGRVAERETGLRHLLMAGAA